MSSRAEYVMRASLAKAAADERMLKFCLGRWASELEPSACYYRGQFVGLCVEGDPTGKVIVPVNDVRPLLLECMRILGVPTDTPSISWGAIDLGYD